MYFHDKPSEYLVLILSKGRTMRRKGSKLKNSWKNGSYLRSYPREPGTFLNRTRGGDHSVHIANGNSLGGSSVGSLGFLRLSPRNAFLWHEFAAMEMGHLSPFLEHGLVVEGEEILFAPHSGCGQTVPGLLLA